ncbi:VOC family protein [Pararhizobium haloflavum]|uniref:VOC family protein n=1 Tax=Pararhizobium haloflavum TaxID=2037914 RepID=UPI000C1A1D66|nr:VOC family protein [Pararhizobium haloflavum]
MTKPDAMQSPRIFPTFRCNDPDTVIAWLCDVVGFAERVVYRSGGHVVHAELAYGSSIIMLGRHREDGYGQLVGDPAGRRTDAIYIAVDDADALFARIKASGVTIEAEPYDTNYGSRDFSCRDPDGNLWAFGTYWPKVGEKPIGG